MKVRNKYYIQKNDSLLNTVLVLSCVYGIFMVHLNRIRLKTKPRKCIFTSLTYKRLCTSLHNLSKIETKFKSIAIKKENSNNLNEKFMCFID